VDRAARSSKGGVEAEARHRRSGAHLQVMGIPGRTSPQPSLPAQRSKQQAIETVAILAVEAGLASMSTNRRRAQPRKTRASTPFGSGRRRAPLIQAIGQGRLHVGLARAAATGRCAGPRLPTQFEPKSRPIPSPGPRISATLGVGQAVCSTPKLWGQVGQPGRARNEGS